MSKVAQDVLDEFGRAVKRARGLKGWTLDQLSSAMDGTSGKSFLSNIEKGQRSISAPTVGKLIAALELEESWIDAFIDTDVATDTEETKIDRDAERLMTFAMREGADGFAAEELLIQLANSYAEGDHVDLYTAYNGLRAALQAAADLKARSELPDNTGGQLQAVLREVARLNDAGNVDAGAEALDAEMKRHLAEERETKERLEARREAIFNQQLVQDRIRNDPEASAKRLLQNLRQSAPAGGVRRATDILLHKWRERGETQSSKFDLRVALALAKHNWDRAKKPQREFALTSVGNCHLALAQRSTDLSSLNIALSAFRSALSLSNQKKNPKNWGVSQNNLGNALSEVAERTSDAGVLREAIMAYQADLTVTSEADDPKGWGQSQNNLGVSLQKLGELERDATHLQQAIAAHTSALRVRSRKEDPKDWADTQNNLGLTYRWIAEVTQDHAAFGKAQTAYDLCLQEQSRETAPLNWATTQWNLADLALARYSFDPVAALLTKARTHVMAAREVFAEASDYQTERCDELLALIEAA